MKGVKGFIQENLPSSWDKALREHKCLGSFIEQFYQAIAKQKNRNKYYYKISIMQARHDIKNKSIITIATLYKFKEGISFWNEVNQTVINYESEWK